MAVVRSAAAAIQPEIGVVERPKVLIARPQARDASSRRAAQALVLLVLLFVIAQPFGPALRGAALYRLSAGTNMQAQWDAYQSAPAPDVLFVGPSTARLDVDSEEVGHLLSAKRGHPVRVGKLGTNAESPAFLEALLYRVVERPTRPSMIVFVVAAPMFNPTFSCQGCARNLLAIDLVQISQPYEPAFMSLAWSLDPQDRPLLIGGWFLPAASAGPLAAAAGRCILTDIGRGFARTAGFAGPPSLAPPTACELGAHPAPTDRMDSAHMAGVRAEYGDHFVRDYSFSSAQAEHLRNMVAMARAKGVAISMAQFPNYDLESVNPEAERFFQSQITALAADVAVPMFDYRTELRGDPSLWGDPLHLNAQGAHAFAPQLAQGIDQVWAR